MLFGTSGIRGKFGEKITPDLVFRITAIFASTAKEQNLAIGYDARPTSPFLAKIAEEATKSVGKNAILLGLCPTPTLALYTQRYSCPGIMITASHNPVDHNGIKLYYRGGEIKKEWEKKIENIYQQKASIKTRTLKGHSWKINSVAQEGYARSLIKKVGKIDRLKIVIDINGTAWFAPALFRELGCEVVVLNAGGSIRGGEPEGRILENLGKVVITAGADAGIAFDTDGDRVRLVDEQGRPFSRDDQLMLLARVLVEEKAQGHYIGTVEESRAIAQFLEEHNWKTELAPVGSRGLSELLAKSSADVAAEPCGEYIFAQWVRTPDGVFSAVQLLKAITLFGALSKQHAGIMLKREKIPVEEYKKAEIMARVGEWAKAFDNVSTIDGVRINFSDGFILIRPSGTEDVIRITAEGKGVRLIEEVTRLVKK